MAEIIPRILSALNFVISIILISYCPILEEYFIMILSCILVMKYEHMLSFLCV